MPPAIPSPQLAGAGSALPGAEHDIAAIERAMSSIAHTATRHRIHERTAERAGVALDRAGETLLRQLTPPVPVGGLPAQGRERSGPAGRPTPADVRRSSAGAGCQDQDRGAACGGLRLCELAERLGIEAPSVTRTVQQLERAGLVSRHADPDDQRAWRVEATPAGRDSLGRLHSAKRAGLGELLADWPAEDRHELAALLTRFATDLINRERTRP